MELGRAGAAGPPELPPFLYVTESVPYDVTPSWEWRANSRGCHCTAGRGGRFCDASSCSACKSRRAECGYDCGCMEDPQACRNRTLQRGLRTRLKLVHLGERKGWGVKAAEPIHKGEFIIEYVGEVRSRRRSSKPWTRGAFPAPALSLSLTLEPGPEPHPRSSRRPRTSGASGSAPISGRTSSRSARPAGRAPSRATSTPTRCATSPRSSTSAASPTASPSRSRRSRATGGCRASAFCQSRTQHSAHRSQRLQCAARH